ncbi:unnamed protein product, partial [marine sediment metagenome]
MAKLKAPLMSLGASGAIGKSLVFFPWKGLDCVREYVVPANPKSTAQLLQRSYLTAAVLAIHNAQKEETYPLTEIDTTAYALWGSCWKTPRTWFNTICKHLLTLYRAGDYVCIYTSAVLAEEPLTVTLTLNIVSVAPEPPTDGDIYWGTSKTALVNIEPCDIAALAAGKAITVP